MKACSEQNVNYPQLESFETESEEEEEGVSANMKLDPKLFEVALWAVDMRGISVSNVQRSFSVGFSRAGKIVDQLCKLGICGKSKGNFKPRDILMSEVEIRNLWRGFKMKACSEQNVNYPQLESFETESEEEEEGVSANMKLDPKLFEVALWAVDMRGISVSNVQRSFSVGFSRAGKIVDQLCKLGICGKSKGNSKPRDILMSEEEIRNLMERF